MHGIWLTKTQKYYSSSGPIMSETFASDLTSAALDTELSDFRSDFNHGTGLLLNATSPEYLAFRNNLLSLPKKVKQNGILYLVPGLNDDGRVFGYNAMNRSFIIYDFARNSYEQIFDPGIGADGVYNQDIISTSNNRPVIGAYPRQTSFLFSNISRGLFGSNANMVNTYTCTPNIEFTDGRFEKVAIIPKDATGDASIKKSFFITANTTYTLSVLIKENLTEQQDFYFTVDNSNVIENLIYKKVPNSVYKEDAGFIHSVTFTATSSTQITAGIAKQASSSDITVFAFQLEESADAHPMYRTASGSTINPADQLSLDMNCLDYKEWTIYMDFSYQKTNDSQPIYFISTNSTVSGAYLYSDSPTTLSTQMGFHGGKMSLTGVPQNTRQRVCLKYSELRDPRGPYCTIQREGKNSEDAEWSSGSPNSYKIPFNNHLEFFTGPGFVSAELKAFVIFDKWIDISDVDLEDI